MTKDETRAFELAGKHGYGQTDIDVLAREYLRVTNELAKQAPPIVLTPGEMAVMSEPGRQNYLANCNKGSSGDIGDIARAYLDMQRQYQTTAIHLMNAERMIAEMNAAVIESEKGDD